MVQESNPLALENHWYYATQRVEAIIEQGPQEESKAEVERSTVEVEEEDVRLQALFAKVHERNLALSKLQTQHRFVIHHYEYAELVIWL